MRQPVGLAEEAVGWEGRVHQADLDRLARVDRLRREDHLEGALASDEAREPLRAPEARRQAEPNFRLGELGVLARYCERHGFDDLTAAAISEPVDRGDDRLGEGLQT